MAKLTKEEKEVLRSVEADEWRPVAGKDRELEKYREYARATFKKDRRVNIRISSNGDRAEASKHRLARSRCEESNPIENEASVPGQTAYGVHVVDAVLNSD